MGAVYLDQGYDFVNRLLINRIYARYLSVEDLSESETDYKSRLIEWSQKNRHTISFRTGFARGNSSGHPSFHATVLIDGMEMGHGTGESKKEAEQRAAESVSQVRATSCAPNCSTNWTAWPISSSTHGIAYPYTTCTLRLQRSVLFYPRESPHRHEGKDRRQKNELPQNPCYGQHASKLRPICPSPDRAHAFGSPAY